MMKETTNWRRAIRVRSTIGLRQVSSHGTGSKNAIADATAKPRMKFDWNQSSR
jgi:hypothetical protein